MLIFKRRETIAANFSFNIIIVFLKEKFIDQKDTSLALCSFENIVFVDLHPQTLPLSKCRFFPNLKFFLGPLRPFLFFSNLRIEWLEVTASTQDVQFCVVRSQ